MSATVSVTRTSPDRRSPNLRPSQAALTAGRAEIPRIAAVLTAVLAVVVLVLAGCGAPAAPAAAGGGAGGLEQTTVQVGALPIIDFAAVQRAFLGGYFAAEGLDIEFIPVQGGAAAIPLLVNGELDLTWSAMNSIIAAQDKRVAEARGGLRVLPGSGYAAAENTFVMLALPGREYLATPQDLPGKKIAINTLGSIARLAANTAMAANGVDPRSVSYVEVPFPDMIPALANRQVDAIVVVEPQLTQAGLQLGATALLNVASGPTANLPEAALTTTAEFARTNPNTMAAFARALARGQADMNDRTLVEQTVTAYTKIDAGTATLLRVGTWPATLTAIDLQRVAGLMQTDAALPPDFDVTPLLLPVPAPGPA